MAVPSLMALLVRSCPWRATIWLFPIFTILPAEDDAPASPAESASAAAASFAAMSRPAESMARSRAARSDGGSAPEPPPGIARTADVELLMSNASALARAIASSFATFSLIICS